MIERYLQSERRTTAEILTLTWRNVTRPVRVELAQLINETPHATTRALNALYALLPWNPNKSNRDKTLYTVISEAKVIYKRIETGKPADVRGVGNRSSDAMRKLLALVA